MTNPRSSRAETTAQLMGLAGLALVLGALGFQYIGHLPPCEMCHWQRWPHIAAAILGLAVIKLWKNEARLLAMLTILLVAASGLIGLYQTGMQYHLLPGPQACTGARYVVGSNAPAAEVRCDIPTWFLFGLALPAYNAIFSLGAAALGTFLLVKK
ncbi:MAG TPA: disulfide bond formation protein B [Rhizomicrobium sp.]|nr:disulfide bond formation protein B [Rhizomicrobium sp.]